MASSVSDSIILWQRWLTDERLAVWNNLRVSKGLPEETRAQLAQMMVDASDDERQFIKEWIGV